MPGQYDSEQVAKSMILIVEDVGGASFVILLLLDNQSLFLPDLLFLLLHALVLRDLLLLLRLITLGIRHNYMISTLLEKEIYLGFLEKEEAK